MRIRSENLLAELKKEPSWVGLLVAGDEPYLTLELLDDMRAYLQTQKFSERDVFDVDGRFNWDLFQEATQSLSLFADKKIIELRFSNKPDQVAQKQLIHYLENSSPDLFLLVSTPRLDNNNLRAKWITVFEQKGATIVVYPPRVNEYPRWIAERAARKQLNISREAIELLAENNEGNLFSVMQELDYLALFYGSELIDEESLRDALIQSSRFMTFDLSDALLLGDLDRIYRIINSLREEGEPSTLVNWLLQREIAQIGSMLVKLEKGEPLARVLSSVWQQKRPLYERALQRIDMRLWKSLSQMVVQIDYAIKGQLKEEPWSAILRVCFAMAGRRVLSLSATIEE